MVKNIPLSIKQLESLKQEYGSPLQLYDIKEFSTTTKNLIDTFSKKFPNGFKQFFAVKALPNPSILKILRDTGCGMDCSSTGEIYICKKLGVTGQDIMFTSNYTSKKDLGIGFDNNVVMNLDDLSLVESLVEIRGKVPELISFRLNPGIGRTDSETASNVLGGPDAKFGVPPFQIIEAYRQAMKHGAKRFGIHMMTGSCVTSEEYWKETVDVLLDTVKKLQTELGIETFEFINIGGGIGIPYKPDEEVVDIDKVSDIVRASFDRAIKEKLWTKKTEPKLYMENGRYITGPCGYLLTTCEAIKNTYSVYYGLDACMANLMRPGMYGSYHHISIPQAQERSKEIKNGNVVGTLCENNDWFAKDRPLPADVKVGDLVVIHDTGAHAFSLCFNYNSKLHAPEVMFTVKDDNTVEHYLIRDRQKNEDLFADTYIVDVNSKKRKRVEE